jgi:glycosyltransferase involved in cell wall biosynthesis
MKPVLFVTGRVAQHRLGALARLHEREGIELALFGGAKRHGGPELSGTPSFPVRRASPAQLARLAASGRYRAVVCSTGGRAPLLATWAGARAGGVPLILWASLWAHPRSLVHTLSYLPLRRLYRSADAVVTYGPHVSAYVRARGARNVHVAAQSVDNEFWGAPLEDAPAGGLRCLFVGRPAHEKGLAVLLEAWRSARLWEQGASLRLAGAGAEATAERVLALGQLDPLALRAAYAASDVLVVPSIATRTFREPWGLVVNEAMNRGVAVIASNAVGAAAGGLVIDGETGLVVHAGDPQALAEALRRLAREPDLRARLGAAGQRAVRAYSHEAWAEGFARALATVDVSRERW